MPVIIRIYFANFSIHPADSYVSECKSNIHFLFWSPLTLPTLEGRYVYELVVNFVLFGAEQVEFSQTL